MNEKKNVQSRAFVDVLIVVAWTCNTTHCVLYGGYRKTPPPLCMRIRLKIASLHLQRMHTHTFSVFVPRWQRVDISLNFVIDNKIASSPRYNYRRDVCFWRRPNYVRPLWILWKTKLCRPRLMLLWFEMNAPENLSNGTRAEVSILLCQWCLHQDIATKNLIKLQPA